MKLEYRPRARSQIRLALDYYEGKEQGLGQKFIDELHEILDRIKTMPGLYPFHRGPVKRASLSIFPYSIFFGVTDQTIEILRVYHQSQDTKY